MSIVVCGIGCISAIGSNSLISFNSLINEKRGLDKPLFINTSLNTYLGEVKFSNSYLKELLGFPSNKAISRTSLLGIIAAKEAINSSGIVINNRVALVSSTTTGGMDLSENFFIDFIKNPNKGRLRDIIGHSCGTSTNDIANYFGINGITSTISTACSSSANAIILGAQILEAGMADYVIAGGTDSLCKFTINGFNSLMILSKEQCKPFSNNRDGINLGEGAAFLVLCKDGMAQNVYCKLSGYSNMNDAFHQTASSPDGNGAYLSMINALIKAGLSPSDIDYINAHGTGTPNNDITEGKAIKRVFNNNIPKFSSTKGYTGHTLAASGAIEAVFSVLAIKNRVLYANAGFQEQIKELALSPITTTIRDIKINNVISNSFGFGGNCTSLIFSAL